MKPSSGVGARLSGWSIAIGFMMIAAGVLAVALPALAGIAVFTMVAWVLAIAGAGHFFFAWHTRSVGGALWQVLLGLLYLGVAVYMMMHPVAGLATLTLLLAAYLFIEGVLELILSTQMSGVTGRGWLAFDGVVTLIVGFLIWRTWPSNTDWAIGTLVGISILSSGLTRLMLSLASRSYPGPSTRDRSTGAPSTVTP